MRNCSHLDYRAASSTSGSEWLQITTIDPRLPRYLISAERIPDRRGFKSPPKEPVATSGTAQSIMFFSPSATWPKLQHRAD
jgi:hypothetical protein